MWLCRFVEGGRDRATHDVPHRGPISPVFLLLPTGGLPPCPVKSPLHKQVGPLGTHGTGMAKVKKGVNLWCCSCLPHVVFGARVRCSSFCHGGETSRSQ